ncbi:MAG: protein-export chaperone SecB [Actinobacteria bacterium]|nr:protein-export chaperone SecB [Actinomycetota bacterium]
MNERERAGKVGAVAEIRAVRLAYVDATLPKFEPDDETIEIRQRSHTEIVAISAGRIEYQFNLSVEAVGDGQFRTACRFEVEYDLPEDAELDEADFAAFGKVSVTFTAFPFARELIQSMTTRALLPPLVLGTHRAPIDPPKDDDEDDGGKAGPDRH